MLCLLYPDPLLGGVRGGLMLPIHAQKRKEALLSDADADTPQVTFPDGECEIP